MSNYRYQIRQQLARAMGESITGVPDTNLASGTFGCAALAVYANDYFNDWRGRFYAGDLKDTNFVVTDFVSTAGVVTFVPVGTPKVTDLFELYFEFTPDELNDAINLAIDMVANEALQDKVDATLVVVANQWEYTIPTGFIFIESIFHEAGTADLYSPSGDRLDVRHWNILRGSTPKIWFDNEYASLTTGSNLRLVGQQSPSQLTVDASTCNVSMAYLVYQAKAHLHFSRSDEINDSHWRKMLAAQEIADRERQRLRVAGRGEKVAF